jgi:hypothetical protein
VANWESMTTDERIDAALERAHNAPAEPTIIQVHYHRGIEVFELKLSDGRRLVYPRENLQAVAGATPEQAAQFVIGPFGTDIWWPELDEGHYLPNMLEGRTGNEKWMERLQRPVAA